MNKQISLYQERWRTDTGHSQASRVIQTIQENGQLGALGFVDKYEGRWDLRGLLLPSTSQKSGFMTQTHSVGFVEGRTDFKKVRMSDLDLSYSVLDDAQWDYSTINNVSFDHASVRHIKFWGCHLRDVSFRDANLRDACLGCNIGNKCNEFHDVSFEHAKLRGGAHGFELYENCDFSHADLYEVDFDGARFKDCKFAGKLDSVRFRLHSEHTDRIMLPWLWVNIKRFVNRMEHVDFSSAILYGVDFDCGIDLSQCIFPQDDDHLVIYNQRQVYLAAQKIISSDWEGEDRRIALAVLGYVHLRLSKKDQPIDVINRKLDMETITPEYGLRFFALLKRLNEEYMNSSDR